MESTHTSELKAARRVHKHRLDQLASERQGHETFLTPADKRITVRMLLDALEAELTLRQVKSLPQCRSHLKPVRAHFGLWRAAALRPDDVDAFIEAMLDDDVAVATVNRRTQLLSQAWS